MSEGTGEPGRFRAFLSYSHKDAAWGGKLHRRLESYKIPKHLVGAETARGVVPTRLSPIFRDREELSAAESLSDQVKAALAASETLIVMCSPHAKASRWVAKEIETFRELHPGRPVLAALIDGEPGEAFPEALLKILPVHGEVAVRRTDGGGAGPGNDGADPAPPPPQAVALPITGEDLAEPIAADFRKSGDGERLALLKLVAGMTALPLDALVQRDAQRQLRRVTAITGGSALAVLVMALLLLFAVRAQREAERQRAEAEGLVEYMLTDLRDRLKGVGRLDVMTAVNERAMGYYGGQGDLSRLPPESLARRARILHAMGEDDEARGDLGKAQAKFSEAYRATSAALRQAPRDPNMVFAHAQSEFWSGELAWRTRDRRKAEPHWRGYLTQAQVLRKLEGDTRRSLLELGYAEGNLCDLKAWKKFDLAAAKLHCEAALRAKYEALKKAPDDQEVLVAVANRHGWLADVHVANRKFDSALAQREREALVLKKLEIIDPLNAEIQRRLSVSDRGRAMIFAMQNRKSEAANYFQEALNRVRRLVILSPSNIELAVFEAKILTSLAEMQYDSGSRKWRETIAQARDRLDNISRDPQQQAFVRDMQEYLKKIEGTEL